MISEKKKEQKPLGLFSMSHLQLKDLVLCVNQNTFCKNNIMQRTLCNFIYLFSCMCAIYFSILQLEYTIIGPRFGVWFVKKKEKKKLSH